MRRTGLYKKVGRRYVEVGEYDNEMHDYFPIGATLVVKRKGVTSRYFSVDPDFVPALAVSKYCEDAISKKIMEATEIRRTSKLRQTPLTPSQHDAWENLVKEFGEDARQLEWPSAREAAEEAGKVIAEEVQKLLTNESVREAYEHFMFLCKLTAENQQKTP
jgi:hypothetical protein